MEYRIVLITGASKGLGLETAHQLGKLGFHIILASRTEKSALIASNKLNDDGILATPLLLDVTSLQSVKTAYKTVIETVSSIDVLINNAGVLLDQNLPATHADHDIWRKTLETNFLGSVLVTTEFLPLLRKSKRPRIVNVSSILGSLSQLADSKNWPNEWASGSAAYRASKAALNMYTLSLAAELSKENFKVNSAHPGWVQTDMGGKSAPLTIPEGAKTLVQLATLEDNGPTGGFFNLGKSIPW